MSSFSACFTSGSCTWNSGFPYINTFSDELPNKTFENSSCEEDSCWEPDEELDIDICTSLPSSDPQLSSRSKPFQSEDQRRFLHRPIEERRPFVRGGSVERLIHSKALGGRPFNPDHRQGLQGPHFTGPFQGPRRKPFKFFGRGNSFIRGHSPFGADGGLKRRWSQDESITFEVRDYDRNENGERGDGREKEHQGAQTVLINNEQYTKIQTPRQEVIFKKGSLDRKCDSVDFCSTHSACGSFTGIEPGSQESQGDQGSMTDSTEEMPVSSIESIDEHVHQENPDHCHLFEDPHGMFLGDSCRPPLAGVVMQQAYPGGPMVSVPVHWTPFLDPGLIPGDTALTTLDPAFTHIIDPKTIPIDSAHVLPIQHDATGCPVTVQVKVDVDGRPIEIEPSAFTVSLSTLEPRLQEVLFNKSNDLLTGTHMHSTHNDSCEYQTHWVKNPEKDKNKPPVQTSESKEGNCKQRKTEASAELNDSDSQYASMSEASTAPTTPSGELCDPSDVSYGDLQCDSKPSNPETEELRVTENSRRISCTDSLIDSESVETETDDSCSYNHSSASSSDSKRAAPSYNNISSHKISSLKGIPNESHHSDGGVTESSEDSQSSSQLESNSFSEESVSQCSTCDSKISVCHDSVLSSCSQINLDSAALWCHSHPHEKDAHSVDGPDSSNPISSIESERDSSSTNEPNNKKDKKLKKRRSSSIDYNTDSISTLLKDEKSETTSKYQAKREAKKLKKEKKKLSKDKSKLKCSAGKNVAKLRERSSSQEEDEVSLSYSETDSVVQIPEDLKHRTEKANSCDDELGQVDASNSTKYSDTELHERPEFAIQERGFEKSKNSELLLSAAQSSLETTEYQDYQRASKGPKALLNPEFTEVSLPPSSSVAELPEDNHEKADYASEEVSSVCAATRDLKTDEVIHVPLTDTVSKNESSLQRDSLETTEHQNGEDTSNETASDVKITPPTTTEKDVRIDETQVIKDDDYVCKPGFIMVPILTPYYDPAVLFGYTTVVSAQVPERSFIKKKKKKFRRKFHQDQYPSLHLDTDLYTGEPFIATASGYMVQLEPPQFCHLHGYQYLSNLCQSHVLPTEGLISLEHSSYQQEALPESILYYGDSEKPRIRFTNLHEVERKQIEEVLLDQNLICDDIEPHMVDSADSSIHESEEQVDAHLQFDVAADEQGNDKNKTEGEKNISACKKSDTQNDEKVGGSLKIADKKDSKRKSRGQRKGKVKKDLTEIQEPNFSSFSGPTREFEFKRDAELSNVKSGSNENLRQSKAKGSGEKLQISKTKGKMSNLKEQRSTSNSNNEVSSRNTSRKSQMNCSLQNCNASKHCEENSSLNVSCKCASSEPQLEMLIHTPESHSLNNSENHMSEEIQSLNTSESNMSEKDAQKRRRRRRSRKNKSITESTETVEDQSKFLSQCSVDGIVSSLETTEQLSELSHSRQSPANTDDLSAKAELLFPVECTSESTELERASANTFTVYENETIDEHPSLSLENNDKLFKETVSTSCENKITASRDCITAKNNDGEDISVRRLCRHSSLNTFCKVETPVSCDELEDEPNNPSWQVCSESLKDLGVTEAVKRWIREVSPEKVFSITEETRALLLSEMILAGDDYSLTDSEDNADDDANEMFCVEEKSKNVESNPSVASPSEKLQGGCSERVASIISYHTSPSLSLLTAQNRDTLDSYETESIISNQSRVRLYSSSSSSSFHLTPNPEEQSALLEDPRIYDPSVYSKYYQLGVIPTNSSSSCSSRESTLAPSLPEKESAQEDENSHVTELLKAGKLRISKSFVPESRCDDLFTLPCGCSTRSLKKGEEKGRDALSSTCSSGIGSSLAASPVVSPEHQPCYYVDSHLQFEPQPLRNVNERQNLQPCRTAFCSIM